MSSTVLYMSMSLDGFVAGPNESVDNGLGDGGERLHEWALGLDGVPQLDDAHRAVVDEFMSTGAVLAGRRLFEHLSADHIELETVQVVKGREATYLRYRVRR